MPYASKEDKALADKLYYWANREKALATRRAYYEAHRKDNPMVHILRCSRARAKKQGIPHDIAIDDVPMPDRCPVLGIPLFVNPDRNWAGPCDNSPSIDQIVPRLGYVKGNVRVISFRANRLKCDATLEELELILADLRNLKKD